MQNIFHKCVGVFDTWVVHMIINWNIWGRNCTFATILLLLKKVTLCRHKHSDFCVTKNIQSLHVSLFLSVNPTVSHNVGVFASVCLASRLDSDLDVFTLITVAVALFALFPSFRRYCSVSVDCHTSKEITPESYIFYVCLHTHKLIVILFSQIHSFTVNICLPHVSFLVHIWVSC